MDTVIEGLAAWELEAVAAINNFEKLTDVPEGEASEIRWEQSEAVAKALDAGMTMRKLAESWLKSDGTHYSATHVAFVSKAHSVYYSKQDRPRWYDAYNSDEVRKGEAHVAHNAGDNEWYTPPEYIAAATRVMGGIDLDPASTEIANEVVNAQLFFTEEDDGLSKPWAGRVWMNPPYDGKLVWKFCEKLAEHAAAGDITEACVLVNNATEAVSVQRLMEVGAAICFPARRVKFWHPEKESAPLQGQAVVYVGQNVEAFRREFLEFGFTVEQ